MKPHHALTVRVQYKYVDGAHFFVSDDRKTGLCVAHKNLKLAFEAVAPTLEWLFEANDGMNVKFAPRVSFWEFRAKLKKTWPDIDKPVIPEDIVSPAGGFQWREAA